MQVKKREHDKGHLQLESHLHVSAGRAMEGRHGLEKTCLSALPNNSTLVSLKSFLIVPAGKQKHYPASPIKRDNQNDISDTIWDSRLWRNLIVSVPRAGLVSGPRSPRDSSVQGPAQGPT